VELKDVAYNVDETIAAVKNDPLIEPRAKTMLEDVYRYGRILSATNGNGNGNGHH
jgi:hypothetical protein